MIISSVRGLIRSSSMCSTSASGRISISWSRSVDQQLLVLADRLLGPGAQRHRLQDRQRAGQGVDAQDPAPRRDRAVGADDAGPACTASRPGRCAGRRRRQRSIPARWPGSAPRSPGCSSRWSAVRRRWAIPAVRSAATPRQALSRASSDISVAGSMIVVERLAVGPVVGQQARVRADLAGSDQVGGRERRRSGPRTTSGRAARGCGAC